MGLRNPSEPTVAVLVSVLLLETAEENLPQQHSFYVTCKEHVKIELSQHGASGIARLRRLPATPQELPADVLSAATSRGPLVAPAVSLAEVSTWMLFTSFVFFLLIYVYIYNAISVYIHRLRLRRARAIPLRGSHKMAKQGQSLNTGDRVVLTFSPCFCRAPWWPCRAWLGRARRRFRGPLGAPQRRLNALLAPAVEPPAVEPLPVAPPALELPAAQPAQTQLALANVAFNEGSAPASAANAQRAQPSETPAPAHSSAVPVAVPPVLAPPTDEAAAGQQSIEPTDLEGAMARLQAARRAQAADGHCQVKRGRPAAAPDMLKRPAAAAARAQKRPAACTVLVKSWKKPAAAQLAVGPPAMKALCLKARPNGCSKCRWTPGCCPSCY